MSRAFPRSGSRVRGAVALALALALASACGGGEEPGGAGLAWHRLALAAAKDAEPAPEPRLVERFVVAGERAAWSADAPLLEAPRARPADVSSTLFVGAGKGGSAVRAEREGALDAGTFNRVRVAAGFEGSGSVQVSLLRDGRAVVQSEEVRLRAVADGTYELRLPFWRDPAGACDALRVDVLGGHRYFTLESVELWLDPIEAFVPDPAGGAELARLFTATRANWEAIADKRRGVGVTHRRPLEVELDVVSGAMLAFSCAEPQAARHGAGPLALAVRVRGADGRGELRRSYDLRPPAGLAEPDGIPVWRFERIALGELGDGPATARFELETAAGEQEACVVAELGVASPGTSRGRGPRPSVLLVTSDTHRADHLGSSPDAVGVRTPVLDRLAARGVEFDECFTWANVTNPSHIALMTGTHPRDTGILDNERPLARGAETLAERFAEAGWLTWSAISVRHLEDENSGLGQGFDRMLSPFGKDQPCTVAIDAVRRWLDEREDAPPVFVWLHVFDAHFPYTPPPDFAAEYPPADETLGELLPDVGGKPRPPGEVRRQRAMYKGEVSFLDGELARVLEVPRFRDGVTAVVSDHGESLGQHGIYYDHLGLYPDTLHVPLILDWPGAPAGARVPGLVAQADLGRTLLDLAGLAGAGFPGADLRRHLEPGADAEPAPPHFALHANGVAASVTEDGWHLVMQLPRIVHGERIGQHRVELYELAGDPRCEVDRVEDEHERARALRARLIRWLSGERDLGWRGEGQADSRLEAELAELGYAAGDDSEDPGGSAGPGPGSTLWMPDDCTWCRRFEE